MTATHTSRPDPTNTHDWVALVRWAALPILWSAVWLLVAGLAVGQRFNAGPDDLPERLGWLPSITASLVMTAYLQIALGIARTAPAQAVRHRVATVCAGLFLGLLVLLSEWQIGLAATLIWLSSDLQRQWFALRIDAVRDLQPTDSVPAPDAAVNSVDAPKSVSSSSGPDTKVESMGVRSARQPESEADGQPGAESGAGAEIEFSMGAEENDAEENLATDDELDEADGECDEAAEAEFAGGPAWLQQMTRAQILDSADQEGPSDHAICPPERIEWFYRLHWQVDESQVDVHLLFQPAFADRPRVQVDVVQGAGQVTVADLQPHGVRLLLKRPTATANQSEESVVWLEASGTVRP